MLRCILIICSILGMIGSALAHPHAHSCSGRICLQARATPGCVRPQVWGIVRRLAARVGPIEVTSTCHGRHARNSLHYSGRAVDLRALHVSQRVAVAMLRQDRGVGRIIPEGRGLIHVDLGRGREMGRAIVIHAPRRYAYRFARYGAASWR